ncbi:MAG: response regulator [bacterium]|nr:response regulator [bacterium]
MARKTPPHTFSKKVHEVYAGDMETFDTLEFKDDRVFERYSRPLKNEDSILGRVWSFRDVTERKRAEEERLSLERQVQYAQKLESLGVLAGGIAHDFNNILMVIMGNVELAGMLLSSPNPASKNLKQIEMAAKRVAGVVNQMLAYSGKGKFVIEPIRLNEVVEEISNLLNVSISKKAGLNYNFSNDLPVFTGDVSQVRQVIMNLITNASEAIGNEKGMITISTGVENCDRAFLDSSNFSFQAGLDDSLPEGRYIYLELEDTGCGMDAETMSKIFDPFFTTKFTGRGLGMAAVQGIVRGHRGVLKVSSNVGKGTLFQIYFPVTEGCVVPVGEEEINTPPPTEKRREGTILVADDEVSVCDATRHRLEKMGYNVLTAADGGEAVEVFRRYSSRIDCVLLDLTMPNMDGVEAFGEIQALRPDVKVILCSGYSKKEATKSFTGKGLAGFLKKPYSGSSLKKKLEEVLSLHPVD